MEKTKYTTRYVSRIVLEAETPIAIGSGRQDLLTDSLIVTDFNGLPVIPGTSLAGVIRAACGIDKNDKSPFGYQKGDSGEGSRIIFSNAVMVGKDGVPVDGLTEVDMDDPFYSHFKALPVRQHVRINGKGSTDRGGKFDGQVAYKGLRFCFEMELLSTGSASEKTFYEGVINVLCRDTFRVGGGTRNGYGLMKVVSLRRRDYDLNDKADLDHYASRSASLDNPLEGAKEVAVNYSSDKDWQRYTLRLKPSDFFLFGSGMGDGEADMTPVRETYIEWTDGKPHFSDKQGVLIPASSIKGALAHRTAYHWNKNEKRFSDSGDKKPLIGDDNPAVAAIFGKSGQNGDKEIKRGNILLSDVILPVVDEKILNHVSIDRFTGGSIDGALFTEKVTDGHGINKIVLTIDVLRKSIEDESTQAAFEASLQDIADGLLPLGGGVNRGNGTFTGTLTKED